MGTGGIIIFVSPIPLLNQFHSFTKTQVLEGDRLFGNDDKLIWVLRNIG